MLPPATCQPQCYGGSRTQLQLDVRYLTRPEDGEGGPLPPVPTLDVVDQSELIEKLRRKIAEQETEIKEQNFTIQDLEEELKKALEALRLAGLQVASPTRTRPKREPPAAKECQTDPWFPPAREVAAAPGEQEKVKYEKPAPGDQALPSRSERRKGVKNQHPAKAVTTRQRWKQRRSQLRERGGRKKDPRTGSRRAWIRTF
ncbi:unnamed protein product [Effrenium voratum]|uniref:Uncharacterized protein n=1 Tax=Effrenium voratum TaxID=2562239 RepID=A0AA36N9Q1_9DINO|nr:unnamed protein product [Effrenium voratum]CAJ1419239.1 unnamed protein product [Effrenium voratum]